MDAIDVFWIIVGIPLGALISLSFIFAKTVKTMHRAQDELNYYKKKYLICGGATMHGGYLIQTFDSGINWYNVERHDNGGVIVKGPADPDLLKTLHSFLALPIT